MRVKFNELALAPPFSRGTFRRGGAGVHSYGPISTAVMLCASFLLLLLCAFVCCVVKVFCS